MEIKENKPEDYLPSFKCILRGDSPWATVDKCITNNKMDSGAVKACAKKVGLHIKLCFKIPVHNKDGKKVIFQVYIE